MTDTQNATLAIVGGSGLYDIPGLDVLSVKDVSTPYGQPSAPLTEARLGDRRILFLPRHGKGHLQPPHQVNYRANICALKQAGANAIVSISAVGSLQEEIAPGDVVVVDQYIDLTKKRVSTFFEDGIVAHVGFADPVCPILSHAAAAAAQRAGAKVHHGGTYVCMEGPQFSTRAESRLYRSWGASVIGMTAMPEAKLAREASLPYCTMAMATDYDCWHESEADVTVEAVLAVLKANTNRAQKTILELAPALPDLSTSQAISALENAVISAPDAILPEVRQRLGWLLG